MSTPILLDARRDKSEEHGWRRGWKHDAYCSHTKVRVFLWPKGETILGWLTARQEQNSRLLRPIARAALRKAGYPEDTKLRWNQKAGCGCGCSPGFVAEIFGANVSADYGLEDTPGETQIKYEEVLS